MDIAKKSLNRRKVTKPKKRKRVVAQSYWKPVEIPEGFVLVIDTHEQIPMFRYPPSNLEIENRVLHIGDYSIAGLEDKVAIERKMVSDFYKYLGRERKQTEKKLDDLRNLLFAALVIEADEFDIYKPTFPTKVTREHVRGFLKSVQVQYGIHVYINDDRGECERYILDMLTYFYVKYHEGVWG